MAQAETRVILSEDGERQWIQVATGSLKGQRNRLSYIASRINQHC